MACGVEHSTLHPRDDVLEFRIDDEHVPKNEVREW